jgi:hypothetical protein
MEIKSHAETPARRGRRPLCFNFFKSVSKPRAAKARAAKNADIDVSEALPQVISIRNC